MMTDEKINRYFVLLVLLTTSILISGVRNSPAEETKKKALHKSVSPAVQTVPKITLTAVWGDEGGERILQSPLALVRDDKNGDLFITSFEAGEVVILDKSGALIRRLGRDAGLVSPYGVAMDSTGRIYVSEVHTGLVKVFNPAALPDHQIDLSKLVGKNVAPGRITLDKDDHLYVADLNSQRILVVNNKGELVRSWGEFKYLQKAGPAGNDRIVGLSGMGAAVKVFNMSGTALASFGSHTDEEPKNFSFPAGFAVDAKGRLWIADAFQHRLKVFSLEGKFLFNFGRLEEKKRGGFFFPVDLCFGEKGQLFVIEKGANRVQVFEVGDLKL